MSFKKILVVSDNERILDFFVHLLNEQPQLLKDRTFHFVCGPNNRSLSGKAFGDYTIEEFNIKSRYQEVIDNYDLVVSAHCKQLFPAPLTKARKCINIHPGLNPYNRGWYPQVFSILNSKPLGATIHEIDPEIDHGDIIAQKEVPVNQWDTSLDAYNRVQDAEEDLMRKYLENIFMNDYETSSPTEEGNLNLRKDFDALCCIPLDQKVTFLEAIDRLRALTHGRFKNAYFTDPQTGRKIHISVQLTPEEEII